MALSIDQVIGISLRYIPVKVRLHAAVNRGEGILLSLDEVNTILDTMDMAADGIEEALNR